MIILIPAFEPSARLPELVAELRAADGALRVVVVDDGSGARFASRFAETAAAGAEVLRHPVNRGKGAALKTGFRHVVGRHPDETVVTADADGQHLVDDILRVGDASRRRSATGDTRTVVLGCRAFDGAVPWRSRLGNDGSRVLFRIASGWSLSDTQTGLRAMPCGMLDWLLEVPGERFEYEQRALLRLRGAGFRAHEVPIRTIYLEENAASHFRPLADSVRVLLPVLAFAASSLVAAVVDAVALLVGTALTGALIPSIIAARVLSAGANFWMNRRFVFLRRGPAGLLREAGSYALLAALLLVSNIVWLSFLTERLGWPLWIAKLATELVLWCTSFRVQRSAVFGRPDAGPAPVPASPPRPASVPVPSSALRSQP